MRVQSCHPRGKAEETDQSSTPPETSAWNTKKSLKRKSFKHKLKDLQKENADILEANPGKCENSQVSGHRERAFQKSELKFKALQQRAHRLQNCRKRSHWR